MQHSANAMRGGIALAPHVVILAAASWLASRPLPPTLAGAWQFGPWIALAVALLVAAAFGRGRIVFATLAVAAAYLAYRHGVETGGDAFARRTIYAVLATTLPAYLGLLAVLEERGSTNIHALPRVAPIVLAALFAWWIIRNGKTETTDWFYAPLVQGLPAGFAPLPQLALAATFVAFALALTLALARGQAIEAGLAGTIAVMAVAAHGVRDPAAFPAMTVAAGVVLTLAVLQDSYRMAFRDELTGLPGRRALNDRLKGLGRRYAIAMVDVDHFKQFNDTHGHDVGDDVLRMVASHLARTGGGGKAFRYGGEEFTVLFPGRSVEDAQPHLEALRAEIEAHRMTIRGADRPAKRSTGKKKRGSTPARRTVSVTVSIGVSERSDRHASPEAVITAADKALYRAKHRGRNQVCA
jgi:diguanylate cyclase (GGDEF)-like protein